MRLIKMFGLAALAALMAVAFAGATSAMAESTSLCQEDTSTIENPKTGELEPKECSGGKTVTHVHETTLEGAQAVLKTSLLRIECDVLFLGDTVAETSEPLEIEGNFTYTNCSGGCEVNEVSKNSLVKVSRLGHELAAVEGEGEVLADCSGLHCVYNGEGLVGHALGPLLSSETNGGVSLVEQKAQKVEGTLCPKESKLTISTTPLSATYIARGVSKPTSLCQEDTSTIENPKTGELEPKECSGGKTVTHVHETTLEGAQAVLKTSLLTIKCDVLFLGDTVAETSEPLEITGNFTYTNCGSCTVEEVSEHSLIKVSRQGHELAAVEGEGQVLAECSGFHCVYNGEGLVGHALGPLLSSETNGGVSLVEQKAQKVSGLLCPKESKLTISTTPLEKTYLAK